MKLDGAGAPGTIGATVNVRFAAAEDGTTRVTYDADAVVGGMVGGVGQRMLTSVSQADGRRVLRQRRQGAHRRPGRRRRCVPSPRAPPAAAGQVFTAPAGLAVASPATSSRASPSAPAWSSLGVVAGALFGRRR